MPCMGPDCDYAAQRGENAYHDILDMLEKKPYWLGVRWEGGFNPQLPKAREDLKKALRKLFVAEACDTW